MSRRRRARHLEGPCSHRAKQQSSSTRRSIFVSLTIETFSSGGGRSLRTCYKRTCCTVPSASVQAVLTPELKSLAQVCAAALALERQQPPDETSGQYPAARLVWWRARHRLELSASSHSFTIATLLCTLFAAASHVMWQLYRMQFVTRRFGGAHYCFSGFLGLSHERCDGKYVICLQSCPFFPFLHVYSVKRCLYMEASVSLMCVEDIASRVFLLGPPVLTSDGHSP